MTFKEALLNYEIRRVPDFQLRYQWDGKGYVAKYPYQKAGESSIYNQEYESASHEKVAAIPCNWKTEIVLLMMNRKTLEIDEPTNGAAYFDLFS